MAGVLVVTWQGGGASIAALGLSEELVARRHRVRVIAPPLLADRIAAIGAEHVGHPDTVVFDPALGRAVEDQMTCLDPVFFGPALPALLGAEVARERPDVVVIDGLLRSTAAAAGGLGVPLVALVHMHHAFRALDEVVAIADRVVVTLPSIFDRWAAPDHVIHVGPIAPRPTAVEAWPSNDDGRPLVVVTYGTTYMHQEPLIERTVAAARSLDARVLVLTGDELAPDELAIDRDDAMVHAVSYVSHASVFPAAAVVAHHAGAGTTCAALAAGVPSLCVPLGRDQHVNAALVDELGVGLVASPTASVRQLRDAIHRLLTDPTMRETAAGMPHHVPCDGATRAAEVVESACRGGLVAEAMCPSAP